VRREGGPWLTVLWPAALQPVALAGGLLAVAAGYAATLWCYALMGDTWRMGVDSAEKTTLITRGPYAVVRHPIYLFQLVILAGVVLLLPNLLGLAMLALHLVCIWLKAADEEAHLLRVQGDPYRAYLERTGRLWPRFGRGR
jgi:protein-S-isoprenylcysteine O-methyltransferase Ste14